MKIVVLCGGTSTERNVSLKSGSLVAKSLKEKEHDVILLDICKNIENIPENIFEDFRNTLEDITIPKLAPSIQELKDLKQNTVDGIFGKNVLDICKKADIVVLALHGEDGENGTVQARLKKENIKYTGSDELGSKNAMDKAITKRMLKEDGRIKVPFGITVSKDNVEYVKNFIEDAKFPMVFKPSSGGSSIGVNILQSKEELDTLLNKGFEYGEEYILEQYINGREFSVGVLGDKALPAVEIIPKQGFYDYKNKYMLGATKEVCPANIEDNISKEMLNQAKLVHDIMGLKVYSRSDFILSEDGEIYCLEVNTLPGMTPTSLLPQEAKVLGYSHADLCEEIVRLSLEKGE